MRPSSSLSQAKRRANALLLAALAGFLLTSLLPINPWTAFCKAVSEAALVGALADLFAVTALFRRIPIPWLSRHTAVIPRNKDRIGTNLALFVEDKFLSKDTLLLLMRQHDPVQKVAHWLAQESNARHISDLLRRALIGALEISDDQEIQKFIRQSAHTLIDQLNLAELSAHMLEQLVKDGRHQELLDACIVHVQVQLQNEDTRQAVAEKLAQWLKQEYSLLETLHLTHLLSAKLASKLAEMLATVLKEISTSDTHDLRQYINRQIAILISRLQHDENWQSRLDEFRVQLKQDSALNQYISDLWRTTRLHLLEQLRHTDSNLGIKLQQACLWVAEQILQQEALKASLQKHLENIAANLAPEFSAFLSRHIINTVHGWDAQETSLQIEHNIGKDLQSIRVSGTVVGGLLGGLLYALTLLGQQLQHLWSTTP
ncbi:DUF445 domain-containing protein [Alcaligenes endophyticus]|uniref:DUF445 family protein n=2 Tax=Alcaligenes endophyticus TaxID=1929088 RepID=A0ABT8EKT8_9BURK|nr:DUF445 domain-containing protein [Alcaligenes endophyticus]MDN4121904.1 DUF445 family protein [Alcaligenes endophyticus]